MHNKKVLSKIDLGKYKKPNPYKDDIILSNEGQWKYPGSVTRIPSNEITMEDVPYMVWAQPNVGPGVMMEPGEDYYFDNADYVDEYPQVAKQGGSLKKNNTSRSIKATNKLFAQNYLFKKPGKKKIFDPNSKFYQEGGEFVEMDLDDEDIELFRQGGYIVEDISVPQLTQAQEGKETGVESYTSWENAPEEYAPYVTNMEEVPVVAEAAPWAKLSNEYEKKNSKQAFIESKKRDYLKKTNKGLNKMAGLSMDNFPKDVALNFADEYEYKKNNYVTKKLGNQKGFNPRRRDEWVDELTPGERNVVANSKYGSKLQPGYWNRALAGVQELGNTILPGQPLQYNIPGLTKKEQKEMRDSKLSALEMFAPMDIPGAVAANYLKNNGLSTGSNFKDQPAFYSGEKMSNVTDADAMALNPLTYAGLEAIPELGMNLVKGAKALPGAIKASKESGLLSNAYKVNPYSFQKNLPKDVMFRGIGEEGLEDVLKSKILKSPDPSNPDIYWANKFTTADNYAGPTIYKNTGKIDIDGFPQVTSKKSKKVIATYPKSEPVFSDRYTGDFESMNSSIQKSNYLPSNKAKFYKEHWLKGYKEVPIELPGSPNAIETPFGFQNRLFDSNIQLGSFEGKGHLSEKGYNYRTLGDKEIKAIQETNGVFPKVGKAKGGNENVKYWTKGNEKNWYGENPNQQFIRVKENKFDKNKVVNANDVEIFNHNTGNFEAIQLPGSPNTNYAKGVKTSEWLKNYQLAKELKSKELLSPSVDPKILARNPNLAKNVTKAALKKYNTTYRAVTPDINETSIDELLAMRNAGVTDFNNPEQIAKYMSTHIPVKVKGYRANPIQPGANQDLLYTGKYLNAKEAGEYLKKYGTHMTEVRPKMDFTSDVPQEWIKKYYDELPFGVNNDGYQNTLLQQNSNRQPDWQPGTIAGKREWPYWPYVGNKGSKVLEAGKTIKLKQGGYTEAELTPEEIEWYKSQGYDIEELD